MCIKIYNEMQSQVTVVMFDASISCGRKAWSETVQRFQQPHHKTRSTVSGFRMFYKMHIIWSKKLFKAFDKKYFKMYYYFWNGLLKNWVIKKTIFTQLEHSYTEDMHT